MQERQDIEIRSEEVQEILGTPPNWMARYGTLLALVVVVILGYVGYFIEYPEVVEAGITVSDTEPPKRLVTNMAGRIELIAAQNEGEVQKDQVIAVFKSNANISDVLTLETAILSMGTPSDSMLLLFSVPDSLVLGRLKEPLYEVYRYQKNLEQYVNNPYGKLSVDQLKRELSKLNSIIRSSREQWSQYDQQIDLVDERLRREEELVRDNLLAAGKVEKTREDLLSLRRSRESTEGSIKNRQLEIERIRSAISGVRADSEEGRQSASLALRESFLVLQRSVEEWMEKHVITAPISGRLSLYPNEIAEQQFVKESQEVGVVVPRREGETQGEIWLPAAKASAVETGQKVIVRFSSYPAMKFGVVLGRVSSKSQLPVNGNIAIYVEFPKGLVTEFGTSISYSQETKGEATVILADKRFIERVFEPFRRG